MSKVITCLEVVSAIVTLLSFVIFLEWAINGPATPGEYGTEEKGTGCLFWGSAFAAGMVLTISLQYIRKKLHHHKTKD